MNNYWFKNPTILLQNIDEFFPRRDLDKIHKVNAIARLSIYYSILIIILKLDTKYLALSVTLLLLSYFLGASDTFEDIVNKENNTEKTWEHDYTKFTKFVKGNDGFIDSDDDKK